MTSVSLTDWRPVLFGYVLVLICTVIALLAILQAGLGLSAPAAVSDITLPLAVKPRSVDVVLHVLATLTAIIALGNVLARAMRWIGQRAVIGEIIAGIALGPSVLGAISPEAMHLLIPSAEADPQGQVVAALKAIAQLGVVLYMFLVGVELNTKHIRRQAHAAIAISHASIVVPLVWGAALALWLYPTLSNSSVSFTSFALFLGVAMAITAFPVLARILTDRKLEQTELGGVALSWAATDDVTAWCLLALVVGVTRAQVGGALLVIVAALAFLAAMFFVVRPLIGLWMQRVEQRDADSAAMPLLLVGVLCAALTTEAIGIMRSSAHSCWAQ